MIEPSKLVERSNLRITVERHDGERFLMLHAVLTDRTEPFRLSRNAEDTLRDLRRSLSTRLRNFHQEIASFRDMDIGSVFNQVDEALFHLRAIGNDFLTAIRADDDDKRRWIDVLCDAFFPELDRRVNPVRIDLIVGRDDIDLLTLPLEILPIMDPRGTLAGSAPVTGMAELLRALLVFPAFAAIVTRRLERPFDQFLDLQREAEGKVPVKIIRNDEFYRDQDSPIDVSEVEWLRTQTSVFAVEHLWPDDTVITPRIASEKLGICLLNPRARLADHLVSREWSDQIQHFSCHYTSTENEHVLGLRGQPRPLNVSVSMLDLQVEQNQHLATDPRPYAPLIFLNACGSGGPAHHGGLSITELLLRKTRPRAIVATVTPVDFVLAARFARAVYEGLVADLPLGEAIQAARWLLVERDKTPFGLLYLLFGSPDLRIAPVALAA